MSSTVDMLQELDPEAKIALVYEADKFSTSVVEGIKPYLAERGFEVVLEESYASDRIQNIYGILNGTTNYILTRMSEGMAYEDALKKAQELGFAEADPTFDVEGMDASQKVSILSSLAFDARIMKDGLREGITKITKQDMGYAKEIGYTIKLIAMGKKHDGHIELRTHPTMIPSSHVFANINNEVNAVLFTGKNVGDVLLSGKGAGKLPTASVVVTDIIEMAERGKIAERNFNDVEVMDIGEIESRYYLRFMLLDNPGVFAKVANIIGDNNISIAGVSQKENGGDVVPVVFVTHKALEKNLKKAIEECKKLDCLKDEPVISRIEDFD